MNLRMGFQGARRMGVKKSREQVAEENNQGATQKFLREQGDSKNNSGSIEKIIW